ncbi:MAG: amidohydrolase family protein [Pirellulaceae bacterium]
MEIVGRRYDTSEPVRLRIGAGKIQSVAAEQAGDPNALPWIAPGFVDVQVNGYGGRAFNDPELTPEKVAEVCRFMDADGVTTFLPTAVTDSFEVLSHALAIYAQACDSMPEVACRAPLFHLEGPYISPGDGPRGAHPLAHVRPPDWEEFSRLQEAAGGRIRILTMSPEYEGASDFIRRATDSGVVVAIGHTAADSDQIRAAVDAGARFSTHLGNGADGQIRRHPNYIWDQLAEDRLWASLIVDGHHLPPSVVKSFVRAKTPERCLLVSDITSMAGMPPGVYNNTGIGDVEVLPGGKLVVAGQQQYLAGAALPIGVGVANVMRFAGVSLKAAIEMASIRPAELIRLEPVRLEPGRVADLVLFDLAEDGALSSGGLTVRATLQGGEVVFGDAAIESLGRNS